MSDVSVHGEKTVAGLDILKAAITQAAVLALRTGVREAQESAHGTTTWNDRSGQTRGSIRGQVFGLTGRVEARGASIFLENGTRAHEIVARNAKALHFMVNGQSIYRRAVQHPGTKATHFMRTARDHAAVAAQLAARFYVGFAISRV